MVVIDYNNGAWQEPQIMPYGNLQLSPATAALHYGQSIFEGMKANRDMHSNDILLFRPERNAERLNRSAMRMGMPDLPTELFMESLVELIKLDRNWVPKRTDSSLYMRPFMFATDPYVGVHSSESYKFIIFTCPVGPYYSRPISVLVAEDFVRAFKGGTGEAKAAGNYGATLYPAKLAKQQGYDQILWMDGINHKYVDEIGTMNVFFIIDGVAITPILDGTILDGVTRESVMQLLHDMDVPVEERQISIDEIVAASQKGTLQDAFGAGTAATITHISGIGYRDKHYELPESNTRKISNQVKSQLESIKRGNSPDNHNWIMRV
jgi:branched-chain amino acid aminotransferase